MRKFRKKPSLCKGGWHTKCDGRIVKTNPSVFCFAKSTFPYTGKAIRNATQGIPYDARYHIIFYRRVDSRIDRKRGIRECPLQPTVLQLPFLNHFATRQNATIIIHLFYPNSLCVFLQMSTLGNRFP